MNGDLVRVVAKSSPRGKMMDRPPEPWSPSTPAIEFESFGEVVDDHPIVVIHFWAPWNLYDRRFDITLRQVMPSFESMIEFRSFNVDDDRDGVVSRRAGILANVPALACFLYGQRVETLIGMRSHREMATRFEGWLEGLVGRPILYGPKPMDIK